MSLKLENLPEPLRRRILAQIASDDAKAAAARRDADAGVQRIQTAQPEPAAPPTLDRNPKGKRRGKESCGRRYRVEWTIYTTQPHDWDNSCAAIKLAQDELVTAGWLPDGDGWRELEGSAKSVKVSLKNEERVEVRITRIK